MLPAHSRCPTHAARQASDPGVKEPVGSPLSHTKVLDSGPCSVFKAFGYISSRWPKSLGLCQPHGGTRLHCNSWVQSGPHLSAVGNYRVNKQMRECSLYLPNKKCDVLKCADVLPQSQEACGRGLGSSWHLRGSMRELKKKSWKNRMTS